MNLIKRLLFGKATPATVESKLKQFTVSIELYNFNCTILYGSVYDTEIYFDKLNYETVWLPTTAGMTIRHNDNYYIFVSSDFDAMQEVETASHEAVHLSRHINNSRCLTANNNYFTYTTEETQAYIVGHLTKKIIEGINDK